MPAFRHVDGARAGPDALGILVPPGRRTLVVVRPRYLEWDLLLEEHGAPDRPAAVFSELSREEAAARAEAIFRVIQDWPERGPVRVRPLALPDGRGCWVRAQVGDFDLIVCGRSPGEPYRPAVFATLADAQVAATNIGEVLCPPADAEQPIYLNTRHFAR